MSGSTTTSERSLTGRIDKALGKLRRKLAGQPPFSLTAALDRMLPLVGEIGGVIDIGASDGRWSKKIRSYLPEASFLLIEANPHHQAALDAFAQAETTRGVKTAFILAAAGEDYGEINFDASDPFGGVAADMSLDDFRRHNLQASSPVEENAFVRVPVVPVDGEVDRRRLPGPYFLKLDVHGFEVPILSGAEKTLQQAALLQIETYNFQLTADSLRMHQMIGFMEQRGFRLLDMCDPMHRRDGAFWQIDLFFAPAANDVFRSNTFESTGSPVR